MVAKVLSRTGDVYQVELFHIDPEGIKLRDKQFNADLVKIAAREFVNQHQHKALFLRWWPDVEAARRGGSLFEDLQRINVEDVCALAEHLVFTGDGIQAQVKACGFRADEVKAHLNKGLESDDRQVSIMYRFQYRYDADRLEFTNFDFSVIDVVN